MPKVKCLGNDCPICKQLGPPDHVNVPIEDPITKQKSWLHLPKSTYDEIKRLIQESKTGE